MDNSIINPIERVTVQNLGSSLRMVGINLDDSTIDAIIDLVELIEQKGDDISIRDISKLQEEWNSPFRFLNPKIQP